MTTSPDQTPVNRDTPTARMIHIYQSFGVLSRTTDHLLRAVRHLFIAIVITNVGLVALSAAVLISQIG